MSLQHTFASRLRQLRRERGLTQEALSLEVDRCNSYIGYLEQGYKCPTLRTVDAIAKALSIDPLWLLGADE